MPKSPVLKPDDIERILLANGFFLDRTKGSYKIFINKELMRRVVVSFHKKDLPKGTINEIIKQSGLSKDKFK
jgi:predicted RNA binding protein YcfA (HicA-like mRNA interferase family)